MASNPKYGVTYKTSDGKTKTITGLNLGTGSYSEAQITAFIGILAEVTKKEVLSVDITTANNIPAPEPQKDLITNLSIEPPAVTVQAGESTTAEIIIETDPADAVYSLSAPAAPEWVLIDDTTLVFSPVSTTAAGDYEVTIHAATKDNQEETLFKGTIYKKQENPSLKIGNVTENQKTSSSGSVRYEANIITESDGDLIYIADTPVETVGYTKINVKEFNKTKLVLGGFDEMKQTATINTTLEATENYKQGNYRIIISKPKKYFWDVKII